MNLTADLRDRAWALKDETYAAWSTDPRRAEQAARSLRQLLQGASAVSAEELAEVAALADWMDAIVALTQGRMAEALPLLDAASRSFEVLRLAAPAAQAQVPKLMALSVLGRHVEAAESGARTRDALLAAGDRPGASKVSLNLGNLHMRCNQPAQALAAFKVAAVQFARSGMGEHSVMADIGQGHALAAVGQFDEALRIYARAGMRAQRLALPVLQAMADEAAANVAMARGEHAQALGGLERARRRYEALDMPQHLAALEKQLADTYLALRLLPEALALYERALERFAHLQMPVDRAWTLVQCSRARLWLGGAHAGVQAQLREAAALFDAQRVPAGAAQVALARAECALDQGDSAQALAFAEPAQQAFAALQQPEQAVKADVLAARALALAGQARAAAQRWAAARQQCERYGLRASAVACEVGLGDAAAARGDSGDARAHYEAAIDAFECLRDALPDEAAQLAFFVDHAHPYEALLAQALQAHDAALALQRLERMRARLLAARLVSPTASAEQEEANEGELRTRLNWLYRRTLQQQCSGEPVPAEQAEEARRIEHRLLEQARRRRLVQQAAPEAASSKALAPGFDDARLRALLGPEDALVEYGRLGDELFALVVRAEGVHLVRRLAGWAELETAWQAARLQLQAPRAGRGLLGPHAAQLAARCRARMQRLHALLWAPLQASLHAARRVVVVPQGSLAAVPFAALHDGERFLAEQITLAMAPSAQIAAHGLQAPLPPVRSALVLADGQRLPHAAREARAISALYRPVQLCLDDAARMSVLRETGATADLIHLACHASCRADNPRFSALHLADGALTVEWAERLPLRATLVALAACETGLADVGAGEEAVGLVRAFMLAGASRVLASLWPVDDAAAFNLGLSFHRALAAGATPAQALRGAQSAGIAEGAHPFDWAAYTVHGGW